MPKGSDKKVTKSSTIYAAGAMTRGQINRLKMPVLILHGTEDRVVPFEMSRRLYENAPSPKRLKLILGGGHNNSATVGGTEYLKTVRDFIVLVDEGI